MGFWILFQTRNETVTKRSVSLKGVCASSGSACLADSDEPSHVIRAMKPDSTASQQMIRFSLDARDSQEEIRETVTAVQRCVRTLYG